MKYIKSGSGTTVLGENYKKEVLLRDIDLVSPNAIAQLIIIEPRTTVKDHYHKKSTEIFYFLNGSVIFKIDDTETICSPGDLLVCEQNEMHEIRNESDTEARYLAVKTQVDDDTFWE